MYGRLHRALDRPAIAESHLRFGRVNVDVDHIRRKSHVQKKRWAHTGNDRRPVRSLNGARDSCVANGASIDRKKDATGRGADISRPLNETAGMNRTGHVVDVEQVFGVAAAPNGAETRAHASHWRQHQRISAVVREVKADPRLRESYCSEGFDRAPPLRS